MHLGIYRFQGDRQELLAAYDRLIAMIPEESLSWHLCAIETDGIVIYDTCPSEAAFRSFSTSSAFAGAIDAAGLPEPTVSGRPVHAARSRAPGAIHQRQP